jgi:histidinol dehydrogenase
VKVIEYPVRSQWGSLMKRAVADTAALHDVVAGVIADVRSRGDDALRIYEERFDGVVLDDFRVSQQEISDAADSVSDDLKKAIAVAAANISAFHSAQAMKPIVVDTVPGVQCSQRAVPISKVGLYIPGGNAPLFSTVLMLAVPAKIAGCRQIVLCSPPDRQGHINPAILYAANLAGVTEIYKLGGSQAIAAMAVGTKSVPKVYKIFGPGNRFVMEAKLQVGQRDVAIDMPAGPSEVMIIADGTANREFVASDFLSQAEHGPDSQSTLLTTDRILASELPAVIGSLTDRLPRKDLIEKSLVHSHIILFHDDSEMIDFANGYAPEHLIINHSNAQWFVDRIENAGSVFVGPYSPESAGDYASGTNHTLPTSGYATAYSGVNLDSFIKKITFQHISPQGLSNIGETIRTLAENESLQAHRLAVTVRLDVINNVKKSTL